MVEDQPAPAVASKDICCPKCKKPFEGVSLLDISGIKRLRFGSALVYDVRMACIHCGKLFHWHQDEEAMEEDNKQILKIIGLLHAQE